MPTFRDFVEVKTKKEILEEITDDEDEDGDEEIDDTNSQETDMEKKKKKNKKSSEDDDDKDKKDDEDGDEEEDNEAEKKRLSQIPFSKRLEDLGKGWQFEVSYDSGRPSDEKWQISTSSNDFKDGFSAKGEDYPTTLGLVVTKMRKKSVTV